MSFVDVLLGFIGGGVVGGGGLYALGQGKLTEANQKYVQMRSALDTAESELKDTKGQLKLLDVSEVKNRELESKYQKQLDDLELSYQSRISALQSGQADSERLQSELAAARARIADLESSYQSSSQSLSAPLPAEDFTASYESQIQQLQQDYQRQIDGLHSQIEDLTNSHDSRIVSLQQAHESTIEELNNSHQARITELEETYRSQMPEPQLTVEDRWSEVSESPAPVIEPPPIPGEGWHGTTGTPETIFPSQWASEEAIAQPAGTFIDEPGAALTLEEASALPTETPGVGEMPVFEEEAELFTSEIPFVEDSGFFAPEVTDVQNPTYVEPWEELDPSLETRGEYGLETAVFPETETPAIELEDEALFPPPATGRLQEIDDSFFSTFSTTETREDRDGSPGAGEADNSLFVPSETTEAVNEIGSLDELDTSFFTAEEELPGLDFLEGLDSSGNDDNYALFDEMTSSSDEILNQIANQEAEEIGVSEETFSFEGNRADLEFFNSLQTEETYTNASFHDLFSGQDTPTESSFSELLPTESENLEELLLRGEPNGGEGDSWLTGAGSETPGDLDPFAGIDTAQLEDHNGFHQKEEDLDFLNMFEDVNYNGLEPLPSDQDTDIPFDDLFSEEVVSQWDKDQPQPSSPDKLEPHQ